MPLNGKMERWEEPEVEAITGLASRDFDRVNDFISIADDASLQFGTGDFSICLWVKFDNIGASGTPFTLMSKSFTGFEIGILSSRILIYVGGTGGNLYPATTLANGAWRNIIVSRSGSTVTAYLDNVSIGSVSNSANASNIGTDLFIGKRPPSSFYNDGKIADVRIYNRNLTSGERTQVYAGEEVSSGLVGWYLRNTDDVLDYSPEGNDGTNSGSTFSTDGPFD